MGTPLGNDFEAPISPWTDREFPSIKSSSKPNGQQLFEQVSDFYAWYMSWDITPSDHAKTFELLSRIMRIAQVCKDGGLFLTYDEEEKALKSLSSLREDLFDGFCRQHEIGANLLKIIQILVTSNPKARLVARTNELEYMLCVYAPPSQNEAEKARYQLLLDQILRKVTPSLLDTHAHAVSQGLAKIIENVNTIENIHEEILKATKHWL
ncbi:MAG: hypothetical protein JSR93_01340 [Verrucomicrobia bacterium]|nr:hypothetical protein [Verrucomicrobiota bacterium]